MVTTGVVGDVGSNEQRTSEFCSVHVSQ